MKEMRSRLMLMVTAALMLTMVVSCAGTPATEEEPVPSEGRLGEGTNMAVVFAPSGLGDKSLNDLLFAGTVLVSQELGFAWDYVEPLDFASEESLLSNYAQSGRYSLIICNGFSCGTSMEAVAKEFPEQHFMIIDIVLDLPNVASYIFEKNESSYLAGIVAGMTTETNKIGFVGAFDIPIIEKGLAGFKAGVLSVNPEVQILEGYVGSWSDIAGSKEMAITFFDQGADVIYHNASLGGLGVVEASKENGFMAIGYDSNQNWLSPDTVMLSVSRDFGQAVRHAAYGLYTGDFPAGGNVLGLKDEAVYVTNEGSSIVISEDIWAKVEEAKAAIANGELQAPNFRADIPE